MFYLTEAAEIRSIVTDLASRQTLWADTEVADWHTPTPRLSLIQILAEPGDSRGDFAYILDVLDKPELVAYFITKIMANSNIEKIFHNASYDLRFLGKNNAQNVTCTLKMARRITRDRLGVPNLQLKTLAAELCQFYKIDKEEQGSDWGQRPLTQKQLQYAKMDPVYLAQVHRRLLEITNADNRPPEESSLMPASQKSESGSFSVTKVRVAFECPRLFYLAQRFGGKTMFLRSGNLTGIGNPFHDLAKQFVSLAKQEPQFCDFLALSPEQLKVDQLTSQMEQLFYQLAFFPYLQSALQQDPLKESALPPIWKGLKGLIRRYAELLVVNRRHCSAESAIANTFVDREESIKHWFDLPDGTQQLVKGQFDSLILNLENHRLCAIEYKTYQPADLTALLAQVALYSYMLWTEKKVPVDSAVYCVLPEFKEYQFSWEQLENTVHTLIPHKLQQMRQWLTWEPSQPNPPPPTPQPELCDICPQQKRCQTFFDVAGFPSISTPSRVTLPVQPVKSDVKPPQLRVKPPQAIATMPDRQRSSEADAIGTQLVATLQSFGIGVDYQGAAVGPAFIRVKLKPHLGVKVSSLLKLSADLQVQLGIAAPPLIAPQAGYVSVDLPRRDRQIANFEDYIQPLATPPDAPVRIAIGVNLEGHLVEADLSDPNTCHFLVGGTTGSGKSEFLRSLLLSLLMKHSPATLKIALVDPKRVTFPEFEGMRSLYSPLVKDSDRAIELMSNLVQEMESRYRQFEFAGCADLTAYNRNSVKPLPRIVCIFDEYADLMAEKETSKDLEQSIKRLGAMARAAGIHLIVATQRPEAKVVTPIIRSNLPGRVALRTASEADSTIVLGGKQTAAAYLLGKGDLLYQVGSQLQRLQSLLATSIQLP